MENIYYWKISDSLALGSPLTLKGESFMLFIFLIKNTMTRECLLHHQSRVRAYSHGQNAGVVPVMRNCGFVEDARVGSIENLLIVVSRPVRCRLLPSIILLPEFSKEPPWGGSHLAFFEYH